MSEPITPAEIRRFFPRASATVLAVNLPQGQSIPAEKHPGKAPTRFRQSKEPKLNKLETEYLRYHTIVCPREKIHVQAMRFLLANGVTYTPDFICIDGNKLSAIEVKGPHAWEDAIIKLKVAPTIYPWIRWFMVWKDKGQWHTQEALP